MRRDTVSLLCLLACPCCAPPVAEVELVAVSRTQLLTDVGFVPEDYGVATFAFDVQTRWIDGDEVRPGELVNVAVSGGLGCLGGRCTEAQADAFLGPAPSTPLIPLGPAVLGTAPKIASHVEGLIDIGGTVVSTVLVSALLPGVMMAGEVDTFEALTSRPSTAEDTSLLERDVWEREVKERLRTWEGAKTQRVEAAAKLRGEDGDAAPRIFVRPNEGFRIRVDVADPARGDTRAIVSTIWSSLPAPKMMRFRGNADQEPIVTSTGTWTPHLAPDAAGESEAEALPLGGGDVTSTAWWRASWKTPIRMDERAAARLWRGRREDAGAIESEPLFCSVHSKRGSGLAQWVHGNVDRFMTRFTTTDGPATFAFPAMTLRPEERIRFSLGRAGMIESHVLGDVIFQFSGAQPFTIENEAARVTCYRIGEEARARERREQLHSIANEVERIAASDASPKIDVFVDANRAYEANQRALRLLGWLWDAAPEETTALTRRADAARQQWLNRWKANLIDAAKAAPSRVEVGGRWRHAIVACAADQKEAGHPQLVRRWIGEIPPPERRPPLSMVYLTENDAIWQPGESTRCPRPDDGPTIERFCPGVPALLARVVPESGAPKDLRSAALRAGDELCAPAP